MLSGSSLVQVYPCSSWQQSQPWTYTIFVNRSAAYQRRLAWRVWPAQVLPEQGATALGQDWHVSDARLLLANVHG